jgi:hypothetical protein
VPTTAGAATENRVRILIDTTLTPFVRKPSVASAPRPTRHGSGFHTFFDVPNIESP